MKKISPLRGVGTSAKRNRKNYDAKKPPVKIKRAFILHYFADSITISAFLEWKLIVFYKKGFLLFFLSQTILSNYRAMKNSENP
jgi:hypothetical protein